MLVDLVAELTCESPRLTAEGQKKLAFERAYSGVLLHTAFVGAAKERGPPEPRRPTEVCGWRGEGTAQQVDVVPVHLLFFAQAGHEVVSVTSLRSGGRTHEESIDLDLESSYHRVRRDKEGKRHRPS